jgi:hypothetical protein
MTLPTARQKRELQQLFAIDRTLTTVQLNRRGLLGAAKALELPSIVLTSRTRTTQSHSDIDLTYVAWDAAALHRSERELKHDAGLAETRFLHPELTGGTWKHLGAQDRVKGRLPDAEYCLHGGRPENDWAIEVDAGYPLKPIEAKILAADQAGYGRYIWATTIRARPDSMGDLIWKLDGSQQLVSLQRIEVCFVNFWSPGNPYVQSRRTNKQLSRTYVLVGAATRST